MDYGFPEPIAGPPILNTILANSLTLRCRRYKSQGEFVNREEAIEDLLSTGIRAYKTSGPMDDEDAGFEDDGMMGHEDEYVF